MDSNGNGKWLRMVVGFLFTVVIGIWLLGLTQGVVANERNNIEDHKDIREERKADLTQLRIETRKELTDALKDINITLKENNVAHIEILSRLSRIEAKVR